MWGRGRPKKQLKRLYDGNTPAPFAAESDAAEEGSDDDDDDVMEPLLGLGGLRRQAPQAGLFAHLSGLNATPSAQTATGVCSACYQSPVGFVSACACVSGATGAVVICS